MGFFGCLTAGCGGVVEYEEGGPALPGSGVPVPGDAASPTTCGDLCEQVLGTCAEEECVATCEASTPAACLPRYVAQARCYLEREHLVCDKGMLLKDSSSDAYCTEATQALVGCLCSEGWAQCL